MRKTFLTHAILGVWVAALLVVMRPEPAPRALLAQGGRRPKAAVAGRRPNLLILVADDHRAGTLGVDGDPRRATPRIDALARQGVRLTRAFCNAPVCTASRQSFLTGRFPHAVAANHLNSRLPDDATTLGDWLSRLGYRTAAYGKLHFNSPNNHGFAERLDVREYHEWLKANPPEGGDRGRPWRPFKDPASVWLNSACESSGLPAASTDSAYFADQAVDFLRQRGGDPFALVVGFYDPHAPFKFPREDEGRFRPEDFPVPEPSAEELAHRPRVFRDLNGRDAQGIQAAYYTSLGFVDRQVGRVVDALDALGLAPDTVVVYLSDNGYLLGEHGRFEKHCFYEEAVRVPLVVRWTGRVPAGKSADGLVELVDLVPTLLDLLGVDPPPGLHGRTFAPLLRGDAAASGRDVVVGEYLENEEAMARSDRYKLVVGNGRRVRADGYETGDPPSGPYRHLYHLKADPGETRDLAADPKLAPVREALLTQLYERLKSTRDGDDIEPVPRALSPAEAVAWCLIPREPAPAFLPARKRRRNDRHKPSN